eukprot:Gb_34653 [translate_table: standard]
MGKGFGQRITVLCKVMFPLLDFWGFLLRLPVNFIVILEKCALVFKICIHLRMDEKNDVYDFGMVLLELIIGKRLVGEFGVRVDIVQCVRKMINSAKEGNLNVLDSRLSTVPLHEVMHVFYVAMLCVKE